ncbi:hypothetical protein [Nitratireductor sp. GZWM139]|uniref:hypothetical protein n=1 Tax=Nitratireductor sp. GZWM139 TaxID=2950541 RepID=UPI0024BE42CE|nr:hypothetical protein [Nitratireductor sp. GZWM139]MDJ1464128.1 hypothetical protein [Nitratireductor sp. GZWM139]
MQREWVSDILESLPSLIFITLWRSGFDQELTGWIGVALAACVLIGFRACRLRFHPVLLGINIHLLIITPLIIGLYEIGLPVWSDAILEVAYRGVLITVFLTGFVLTFTRAGFIGVDGVSKGLRPYSFALLFASALAIVWSFFVVDGGPLTTIALPVMALFGLRRFLIARLVDRNGESNLLVPVGAGVAFGAGSVEDV